MKLIRVLTTTKLAALKNTSAYKELVEAASTYSP